MTLGAGICAHRNRFGSQIFAQKPDGVHLLPCTLGVAGAALCHLYWADADLCRCGQKQAADAIRKTSSKRQPERRILRRRSQKRIGIMAIDFIAFAVLSPSERSIPAGLTSQVPFP